MTFDDRSADGQPQSKPILLGGSKGLEYFFTLVSEDVALAGIINGRYQVVVMHGDKLLGKSMKQIQLLEFYKSDE